MNPKEFVEAFVRAADSDAADNKPERDADNKQSYCTRLSLLVTDMMSSRKSEPEKELF
jgi:hypothetical protein